MRGYSPDQEFECDTCQAPLELGDVTDKDGDILPIEHRRCWKCEVIYQQAMRERYDEETDE